ncbi:MAG: response regulator [Bacteroidetes bacterium]|nr:response regulator [Bacteroidota bacterium]
MDTKYKILYVDDEESNLLIFKDTFRRDFEIQLAISAYKALEILEQGLVDIVITDQRMPGMTGVELLKEINERFSEIPPNRLMISGYSEDSDIKEAFLKYKLYKFVPKPWDYKELKQIIINAVKLK